MSKYQIVFFITFLLLWLGIWTKGIFLKQIPVPISMPLNTIPKNINNWRSNDLILKKKVISILGVDDYLYRAYQKDNKVVCIYVGYYKEQKQGAIIHSPKHCFLGEGFDLLSSKKIIIKTKTGEIIHATKLIIGKYSEKKLVLYWYQNGKKTISNDFIAKLNLIIERIFRKNSSGALVRIISKLDSDEERVLSYQIEFINSFYPYLLRSFGSLK